MQCLLRALDDETTLLKRLVECTQKEQEYILAFEPDRLENIVRDKQSLLERLNDIRIHREHQVLRILNGSKPSTANGTLTALIDQLPLEESAHLARRKTSLLALVEALRELNDASSAIADRQRRWAVSCRNALTRTNQVDSDRESYGPSGRRVDESAPGIRLNASV